MDLNCVMSFVLRKYEGKTSNGAYRLKLSVMLTKIERTTCLYPVLIMLLTEDWQKVFSEIINADNATFTVLGVNYERKIP